MQNYRLTIQYDGGRYKGWQRLNDEDTIQAKIEQVLSELAGERIVIIGSSRTDAGVHALAQVANFHVNAELAPTEIQRHLNRYLPRDISVSEVVAVRENFHARYQAKAKTYLYKIWNEEYAHPFMRKYSLHVAQKLSLARMQAAAAHFIGEHDFTAFSNAKSKSKTRVRRIQAIDIAAEAGFILIRVRGDGFLHNMVRNLVGALIAAGLGELDPATIPQILAAKERRQAGQLADARGLYLEGIEF